MAAQNVAAVITLTPGTVVRRRISTDPSVACDPPLGGDELLFEKVDLAQRAVDRLARLDRQLKLLEPAPTGHPEKVADHADPFGHAAAALPRLQAAATDAGPKTDDARHLGPAATVIGAFDVALTLLDSAIEGMRFEGRLGDLPRLLALRGMVAARLADWDVAVTSADESHRLADELE